MKPRVPLTRRLALTLAMVALLLAGAVAILLSKSLSGSGYLVATRDLASGQPISAEDFTQVRLSLPSNSGYISKLPAGLALAHPLRQGELINLADLTNVDSETRTRIAITATTPLASNVVIGSLVDIWFIPTNSVSSATTKSGTPIGLIAAGVQVLNISKSQDSFGATKTQLEVEVDNESIAPILAAQSSAGLLSAVAQG